MSKLTELWNNVDFDYPNCGGYIISRGTKYLTIERVSNYHGDNCGGKCRIDLSSNTAHAIIQEIDENDVDVEYLDSLNYVGGLTVQ